MFGFPAEQLTTTVEEYAGVVGVMRHITYPTLFQYLAVSLLQELVISATDHYLYFQLRDRFIVESSPERAWRIYIRGDSVNRIRRNNVCVKLLHQALRL